MLRKVLPVLLPCIVAVLSAAAIEFLPETLYFPVIEYATPENIRFGLYKNGELDREDCENGVARVAAALGAKCPTCSVVKACVRGLNPGHRKVFTQEPLATPSLRMAEGKLTMTVWSEDPQLALAVCERTALQSASQPADQRLHCFPALALR